MLFTVGLGKKEVYGPRSSKKTYYVMWTHPAVPSNSSLELDTSNKRNPVWAILLLNLLPHISVDRVTIQLLNLTRLGLFKMK